MSEGDVQRPESDADPLADRWRDADEADGSGSAADEEPTSPGATLEELRQLLFGGELQRLERLEQRRPGADEVAEVLDAAVRQSAARGDRLARALGPTIEGALQQSVRRNPKGIVDAIAPALGPAIRKSIRKALAGMVEGFNQVLENTFSARGMRWRIEAFRTGRPFSEVALMNSLVYRVEQVYLIHREDGLVLQHVAAPAVEAQDADMVAGMLSAIRQLAADSFGRRGNAAELAQVELGDLTLEIAGGARVSGSAGLGLYYCASTIERWGGSIGYRERPGGGALFWFELPRASARPRRTLRGRRSGRRRPTRPRCCRSCRSWMRRRGRRARGPGPGPGHRLSSMKHVRPFSVRSPSGNWSSTTTPRAAPVRGS